MNVIYTGKQQDFSELQNKKLNARIAKVGKMVDGRGEKGLHVIFATQRHLTKAEATLNYYGHTAVGAATEPDGFQALIEALAKLEKQVTKLRDKWVDGKKRSAPSKESLVPVTQAAAPASNGVPRVSRVQVSQRRKPMTVEEAVLVIGKKEAYLPFRDVDTGNVSVLFRRPDGHYDLIET